MVIGIFRSAAKKTTRKMWGKTLILLLGSLEEAGVFIYS